MACNPLLNQNGWGEPCDPGNNLECGDSFSYTIWYCPSYLREIDGPYVGGGGGGGGGGSVPRWHKDTMTVDVGSESDAELGAAYEPVNANGFVFRANHLHSPVVVINFVCQRGDRHYFDISDALWTRNNNRGKDLGGLGWRGSYALNIVPFTRIEAKTPGESLPWISRLTARIAVKPLPGYPSNFSGTFVQGDRLYARFVGLHYY